MKDEHVDLEKLKKHQEEVYGKLLDDGLSKIDIEIIEKVIKKVGIK